MTDASKKFTQNIFLGVVILKHTISKEKFEFGSKYAYKNMKPVSNMLRKKCICTLMNDDKKYILTQFSFFL